MSSTPEVFNLSRYDIVEHEPCYNRLILKIMPSKDPQSPVGDLIHCNDQNIDIDCGDVPFSSSGTSSLRHVAEDREKLLFIGFENSWERDMWSTWLLQVNIIYIFYTSIF